MFSRATILTTFALLGSLLLLLASAGEARAHRLEAAAFLLPDGRVQVESWFSDGTPPAHAKVQALGADDKVLVEGELNEKGIFVFSPGKQQVAHVVIWTVDGHRKKCPVTPAPLPGTGSQDSGALQQGDGKPSLDQARFRWPATIQVCRSRICSWELPPCWQRQPSPSACAMPNDCEPWTGQGRRMKMEHEAKDNPIFLPSPPLRGRRVGGEGVGQAGVQILPPHPNPLPRRRGRGSMSGCGSAALGSIRGFGYFCFGTTLIGSPP